MEEIQGQTLDIVKSDTEYKGCTFCFFEIHKLLFFVVEQRIYFFISYTVKAEKRV